MADRALFPELEIAVGHGSGILPWQELKRMVGTGQVSATPEISELQIQPASIDLRLGPDAYLVQASFLRGRSATLMTKVRELLDSTIDLTAPTPQVLSPGSVYIIPLLESLRLPSDIQGVANPKSTTGRLDIFTRLITEHGDQFDRVPPGYKGALFVEVSSRTFPIRLRYGMTLNQLRFVRGPALEPIRNGQLKKLASEQPLVYGNKEPLPDQIGDGIQLKVDLEGDSEETIVAYKAKESTRAIELDKINFYNHSDYWEAIKRPHDGQIILNRSGFYLLASKERVSIPLDYAAEMVAHDPSMGEFRVHYAGFFDPGFGFGSNKDDIKGTTAVLEVRAYEVPILLQDNDVVARLHYYQMASRPEKVYGVSIGSSYQKQGLALSKQFKREPQSSSSLIPTTLATAG
jgi:dCTP deaminase